MTQRKTFLSVRLDARERKRLESICCASGLTASTAVRKLIAGTPIPAHHPKDFKALYTEINRIGNNINQIARGVNVEMTEPKSAASQALLLLRKVYALMEKAADG